LVYIVRTDRQTESHTDRITEADQRYTHATAVGVSNKMQRNVTKRKWKQSC